MFELDASKSPKAPEIIPGGAWFNSTPLTLNKLKGKVVLVDFWTYSCINCIRTLPYLKSWWEKYENEGLVIIGVHSPEFEFEKNEKNVQKAINDFGLKYPIVQDNDFATWRAYNNRYWPAKYLIDKDGFIRYTHFGEGEYDKTEKVIQELLSETGTSISQTINNPQYQVYSRTHETYLGYERIDNFASNEQISPNVSKTYTIPSALSNDQVAFEGNWNVMEEYANPAKKALLYIDFESKEVFLVMKPKGNNVAKIKVYVDNKLQYFGEDNKNGEVIIDSDRLYKLIDLPTPGRHLLKIEFEDNNLEVYAFTFG